MPRPSNRISRGAVSAAALFMALAMAACGGGSTATPTAAPLAATTATPIAQPAPTPIALARTFTASDGRSVGHPDGWVVREDMGFIYAATSEAAASRLVGTGSLEVGDIFVQLSEYAILAGATADPAVHLPDNLRLLLEGGGFTAGAPEGLPWAERPAARIDAANDTLEMLAVSVKVRDDLFADAIAYTAKGRMEANEALILAMIHSLTYPVP